MKKLFNFEWYSLFYSLLRSHFFFILLFILVCSVFTLYFGVNIKYRVNSVFLGRSIESSVKGVIAIKQKTCQPIYWIFSLLRFYRLPLVKADKLFHH